MGIVYHANLIQGTDEWYAERRGLLTASEMKHIITPSKLQYASNDKERAHLYELAAQRISGYVEPAYIGDAMIRGQDDEATARILYSENYAHVELCGFITNDKWGYMLGYSPDGLVGDDGAIEAKSRRQKFQIETVVNGKMPDEFMIQVQTGMLVSERKWCDFISYSGGLPMFVLRINSDEKVHAAILEAAAQFHAKLENVLAGWEKWASDPKTKIIPTERTALEMFS